MPKARHAAAVGPGRRAFQGQACRMRRRMPGQMSGRHRPGGKAPLGADPRKMARPSRRWRACRPCLDCCSYP